LGQSELFRSSFFPPPPLMCRAHYRLQWFTASFSLFFFPFLKFSWKPGRLVDVFFFPLSLPSPSLYGRPIVIEPTPAPPFFFFFAVPGPKEPATTFSLFFLPFPTSDRRDAIAALPFFFPFFPDAEVGSREALSSLLFRDPSDCRYSRRSPFFFFFVRTDTRKKFLFFFFDFSGLLSNEKPNSTFFPPASQA